MSDQKGPGDLPPDLPPEYAEAYRRGYERAYQQAAGEATETRDPIVPTGPPTPEPDSGSTPPEATTRIRGPLYADDPADPADPTDQEREPEPAPEPAPEPYDDAAPILPTLTATPGGAHAGPETAEVELPHAYDERPERPPWLVPALLAGAVLVLLIGAYGIGRVFSSSVSGTDTKPEEPNGVVLSENGSTASAEPQKTHKPQGKKYDGPVGAVDIGSASASCESKPGVDAAGHKVRYGAGNVYDGDMTTAWRCDGDGSGEKLTLELPGPTKIGEIGMVPGYAKTDPRSGADRYQQNNRITKVRWVFSDGTAIVQKFDPSPEKRSPQTVRIPVTEADQVVVEILGSRRGPRNTVAISEVRLGEVSG